MSIVYIGLGSNMQRPRQQLISAKAALEAQDDIEILACSDLYQSAAMIIEGSEAQDDYINAVIKIRTDQEPEHLLDCLQNIENKQGRERHTRWASRTLDLDILLFDQLKIKSERLIVPHQGIADRHFVIYPLQQIEPELAIPGLGNISHLASQVSVEGIQRLGIFA